MKQPFRPTRLLILLACAWPFASASAAGFNNCAISNLSGVVFNTNLVSGLTSSGGFTVSCSGGSGLAAVDIGLSAGSSNDASARTLRRAGGGSLSYNLYKDASYSAVWGTSGTALTRSSGNNAVSSSYTLYGRINPGSPNNNQPPGSYSDALILTLNY